MKATKKLHLYYSGLVITLLTVLCYSGLTPITNEATETMHWVSYKFTFTLYVKLCLLLLLASVPTYILLIRRCSNKF